MEQFLSQKIMTTRKKKSLILTDLEAKQSHLQSVLEEVGLHPLQEFDSILDELKIIIRLVGV
jgi:hypothetical protein